MRLSISALTLLAALTGLAGCADVGPRGSGPSTDYRALYERAFQTFVAETVEEKRIGRRQMLNLKADYPERLRQMTARLDREAALAGIGSATRPVTRSITRERVKAIVEALPGQFNSDAVRSVDPAQIFAESLLFNGAALTYTDYAVGAADQSTYERIWLAGTLVKADCGFFSCFENPKDALSWQVVRQKVPYLSREPILRQAELAALNWDLTSAETLCRQGKSQTDKQKVEALIKEYVTLRARILRSRAQTRANVEKWKQIDRERAARSRQHASARFLRELQTAATDINSAARQQAQNRLTTAVAMQSADTAMKMSGAVSEAGSNGMNADDRQAYLARLNAVRALKAAEMEWKGLWEVVQSDLITLYNDENEGRAFRAQLDRETAAAKQNLAEKKAAFDTLCDNEAHEKALRRYLNVHPEDNASIVINLKREEKEDYAAGLKARYRLYYEKQRRLSDK